MNIHGSHSIRREIGPVEMAQRREVKIARVGARVGRLALPAPQPAFLPPPNTLHCIKGYARANFGFALDHLGRSASGIRLLPMSPAKIQSLKHCDMAGAFYLWPSDEIDYCRMR